MSSSGVVLCPNAFPLRFLLVAGVSDPGSFDLSFDSSDSPRSAECVSNSLKLNLNTLQGPQNAPGLKKSLQNPPSPSEHPIKSPQRMQRALQAPQDFMPWVE